MPNNMTKYDAFQVLRSVYDVDNHSLRVTVVEGTTGDGPGFEVIISHTDDSIRLGDGTKLTTATSVGSKVGLDTYVINEVQIGNIDASKDNIAIHDSDGHELNVNPNGSLNVAVVPATNVSGLVKYAEIPSVVSGAETTIVSFMAIGGRRTFLQKISGSGDNIAKFQVKVDGITIDMKRTNYVGYNVDFQYDGQLNSGLEIAPGSTVSVTVIHERPNTANFNAQITYAEVI